MTTAKNTKDGTNDVPMGEHINNDPQASSAWESTSQLEGSAARHVRHPVWAVT